jgi:hypothetical protein
MNIGRSLAWSVAALGRVKKMPQYEIWMSHGKPQLTKDEIQKKKVDQEELAADFMNMFEQSKKRDEEKNRESETGKDA